MKIHWNRQDVMKTIWFTCCLIVTTFVRAYKISDIPYGIHTDEAGMGYDAWLLQQYHVDRWLNHLPVYLINFGGGQNVLFAHLAAILIKLSGGGHRSFTVAYVRSYT